MKRDRPFPLAPPPQGILRVFSLALVAMLTGACTLSLLDLPTGFGTTPTPTLPYALPATPTPLPQAEFTIRVTVPEDTPGNDPIFVTLLDEVTGLALNPRPLQMQAEGQNRYVTRVLAAPGSMLKYRYSRQGALSIIEHSTSGRPVRYRLLYVEGPGVVEDLVSRWSDNLYSGPTGRIQGRLTDQASGQPLPNLLVTGGGVQTISASDGTYLLEGLPPGLHNLVIYALDGAYRPFQQGALVAAGATTPASVQLIKAPVVDVTFTVILPPDSLPGVPVRLAGNLRQLGNTFADLDGGISSLANRMPVLSPLPDGRQTVTLSLPAGTDLRYKFTLGDGFWNAEHQTDGGFRLRQLIVPETPHQVEEVISTWKSGNSAPIWFDVDVPADTPAGDQISLQFNPYGWTQSLPMWQLEERRWGYLLSSPLDLLGTIGYRYCRNEQCGIADDALTPGQQSGGRPVSTSLLPQTLRDSVSSWQYLEPPSGPVTVPGIPIQNRGPDFIAGVEFHPDFHPTWMARLPHTLAAINGMQANWAVLTPTWTFTRVSPPVLDPLPGQDPLWDELTDWISRSGEAGLRIALRPEAHFPVQAGEWWAAATRDGPWWQAWFERYRAFALHHADLGARMNAPMLVLGGEWMAPALPGGVLADGSPSGIPGDAEARWRQILAEVRTRYGGTLAWALPYRARLTPPPAFLEDVDQIVILWQAPLAQGPGASTADLVAEATRRLDTEVLPLLAPYDKPVALFIAYPSARGGLTACLPDPQGSCLEVTELGGPNQDYPNLERDLNEQVTVYNAMLTAVNERGWINGFVSQGYYPPVALQDKSISVYGKPAADALSYWFPRLLGRIQ